MSNPTELTVEIIRQIKHQGVSVSDIHALMRDDLRLSTEGAVVVPGFGVMDKLTFIDVAGVAAYAYLETLPRVDWENWLYNGKI